ncbi:hypothetical protein J2T12_002558 [Paenibacillus anaericanus]|nr:hypothetical protein [Paenibacillus anaericanus]
MVIGFLKWLKEEVSHIKNKAIIISGIVIILSISIITILFFQSNKSDRNEINEIDFSSIEIKLLMTQEEVEGLYGEGADDIEGCFGCGMDFSYPELELSGRYSETLDRMDKNGEIDLIKSPKVKKITIAKENFSILGVQLGSSFKDARRTLERKGFKLQSNENEYYYNYYYKGNLFIKLWWDNALYNLNLNYGYLGEDAEKVTSITLEVRVKEDEEIVY